MKNLYIFKIKSHFWKNTFWKRIGFQHEINKFSDDDIFNL